MDRTQAFERARTALRAAYHAGTLQPGSTTHDAIGTLVFAATQRRDPSWWPLLVLCSMDQKLTEKEARETVAFEKALGLSFAELVEVEAAFEGGEIDPLTSRDSDQDGLPARLVRTINALTRLEAVPVQSKEIEILSLEDEFQQ